MKKILIVYSKMVIGGSTTSLLSLLNGIDYSRYSIDLQLYDKSGELQNQINKNVNVLQEMKEKSNPIKKYIKPVFWRDFLKSRINSKKYNNRLINSQYMARHEALACPKLRKEYDVAISFLEFWPMEYLIRRVKANKKIGWIHIDVKEAGLLVGINNDIYRQLDRIVLVSKSCADNMKSLYPEFKNKITYIPNILVQETVVQMAKEPSSFCLDNEGITFVTACRLVCASKGLDRGVNAFARLKKEGLLPDGVRWYIIGDGPDRNLLEQMINENGLGATIILLGQQKNPYKIEKSMQYFLLPSRYEGKPMAVTEAQMLGIVPIVCNYSSANEQINNRVDGIICENNDEAIYDIIKEVINGTYEYDYLKYNVSCREYGNIEEIEQVYELIEGIK